jgi:hypothetical protein
MSEPNSGVNSENAMNNMFISNSDITFNSPVRTDVVSSDEDNGYNNKSKIYIFQLII